jgi:hypothetical protein
MIFAIIVISEISVGAKIYLCTKYFFLVLKAYQPVARIWRCRGTEHKTMPMPYNLPTGGPTISLA